MTNKNIAYQITEQHMSELKWNKITLSTCHSDLDQNYTNCELQLSCQVNNLECSSKVVATVILIKITQTVNYN